MAVYLREPTETPRLVREGRHVLRTVGIHCAGVKELNLYDGAAHLACLHDSGTRTHILLSFDMPIMGPLTYTLSGTPTPLSPDDEEWGIELRFEDEPVDPAAMERVMQRYAEWAHMMGLDRWFDDMQVWSDEDE